MTQFNSYVIYFYTAPQYSWEVMVDLRYEKAGNAGAPGESVGRILFISECLFVKLLQLSRTPHEEYYAKIHEHFRSKASKNYFLTINKGKFLRFENKKMNQGEHHEHDAGY